NRWHGTARTSEVGLSLVNPDSGTSYAIPAEHIHTTIGRSRGCDIVVAHSVVSREHAEITLAGTVWTITDHSRNGTLVQGDEIRSRVVRLGDQIQLGSGGPTLWVRRLNGAVDRRPMRLGQEDLTGGPTGKEKG
ncbi:MAG TPA: FHA domain-containing protein, partial [Candidatus Saccharimonadales bacterium]|nr:FHA domain-containing protein [Candidatus Saccharimonadales bacterium]